MKTLLITGGAGYIGSHSCLSLLSQGYELYIIDSFCNSSPEVFDKLAYILKQENKFEKNKLNLIEGNIKQEEILEEIFAQALAKGRPIQGVIHFAGLKSVKESVINPLLYWDENLVGTINLLKIMDKNNCRSIVFSSSATVYGKSINGNCFHESSPTKPYNPYGYTKTTIENLLHNLYESSINNWNIINLRYFNPIGAHPSGLIGETALENAENIFPIVCQVAAGIRTKLYIFGNDWPTIDGTCERDYVHVVDVAEAHKFAIDYLFSSSKTFVNLNIGTGKYTSVLDLVKTFETVNKLKINYEFVKRREGDISRSYADVSLASKILNWKSRKNLEDMCKDGWRWQLNLS